MEMLTKLTLPALLFVLTLAFGVWLSNAGKPYNGALFNIHKLIALGAVIVTGVQFSQMLKTAAPPALLITLLIVMALCVVALFASGALMSANKLDAALMLTTHRGALLVVAIAAAWIAYLLGSKP